MSELKIGDPSEFGRVFAKEFMLSGVLNGFDEQQDEIEKRLAHIDAYAENLHFLNNDYFVNSRLAFSLPVTIDAD